MFITAQSATAMTWEQPKYLSAHKQIKKMCYIYKHIHTHTCINTHIHNGILLKPYRMK